MHKGSKSYSIFQMLKIYNLDFTSVCWKDKRGFYGTVDGGAPVFLGYTHYTIKQKINQGFFDKYKLQTA